MADEEGSAGDKPHEATQKKLNDARRKGEIASSNDLTAAAAYGGLVLAAFTVGSALLNSAAQSLAGLLDNADRLAVGVFGGGGSIFLGALFFDLFQSLWVWLLLPLTSALLMLIAQRAIVFAPEKLAPKLSRISPIANAGQKFGRRGLFEFAKSFSKLAIYGCVLGVYLWSRAPEIVATAGTGISQVTVAILQISVGFFTIVVVVAGIIGGFDFLWQRGDHLRRQRMSHRELMDENKENEGDPWLKSARRQRGMDIATNRMLADVPSAEVVIVNPQHFAVALAWKRADGGAPKCVAKGVDDVAARIREAAAQAGVPIHRDPPTARAVYAAHEIGDEIMPKYYRPVAAAIRFADAMRRRARGKG